MPRAALVGRGSALGVSRARAADLSRSLLDRRLVLGDGLGVDLGLGIGRQRLGEGSRLVECPDQRLGGVGDVLVLVAECGGALAVDPAGRPGPSIAARCSREGLKTAVE